MEELYETKFSFIFDINGEFGLLFSIKDRQGNPITPPRYNWNPQDPNSYRSQLIRWLQNHNQECLDTVECISGRNDITELNDWVTLNQNGTCGLLKKMDEVLTNKLITSISISTKLASGGLLPMYGMPTNQKNLFTSYNALNNIFSLNAERIDIIDRDASMAIYEFAPGAQKTKDKMVHTAIGFVPAYGTNKPFEASYIYTCPKCQHIMVDNDVQNISGHQCPYCGEPVNTNIKRVVMPFNYVTTLRPQDALDDMPVFTQKAPSLSENVTNNDTSRDILNTTAIFANQSLTWKVNDYNGNGFDGHYEKRGPDNNPYYIWISNRAANHLGGNLDPADYNNLDDQVNNVSIACCKSTNVLHIGLKTLNPLLTTDLFSEDPENHHGAQVAIRSAFYSGAFILQRSLAEMLDVNPEEIEISSLQKSVINQGGRNINSAEIILNDQLINGSGFVRHLFESDLMDILAPLDSNSNPDGYQLAMMPGSTNKSFIQMLFNDEHVSECNESCYKCLNVYLNMPFHPILDWRLGISLLRMMADASYACGADGIFEGYPELTYFLNGGRVTWLEYCHQLALDFKQNYMTGATVCNTNNNDAGLWCLREGNNCYVIVHPLWNLNADAGWVANCIGNIQNANIAFLDSFNLQRRQPWCYAKTNEH